MSPRAPLLLPSPARGRALRLLAVLAALPGVAGLAGCSSAGGTHRATGADAITSAATAPLSDLNLVRAKIPPALLAARAAPYAAPAEAGCAALGLELVALNDALGPDLDAPAGAQANWRERGQEAAGEAAVDALRNTTEGVLPFRGWVRKLTGAERLSREVASAVAAGTVRRAYLKGLGQAAACQPPAAPLPAVPPPAPVQAAPSP